MKRIPSTDRLLVKLATCAGAVLLVSACASDPGEEVADAPFPDLAEVPPRPEALTTAEERAALRTQLERRRDEINRAAASLLRGGTEPVPVALDSQVPPAPSGTRTPPPPLPKGLPPSPERPAPLPEDAAGKETGPGAAPKPAEEQAIEVPGEAQMPPPAAASKNDDEDSAKDEAEEGEAR